MEHELIYTSCATEEMSEPDLIELLNQSRKKNHHLNITGLLLYGNHEFAQILEGDKDTIFDLYNTIIKDERHQQVHLLWNGPIKARSFLDWSMAFINLNEVDHTKLEGYSRFLQDGITSLQLTEDKSIGRRIMLGMRNEFL